MFHGSMVALVTPMFENGDLDFEAMEQLIEFHVENGTDAIVAVGTTGESATLNEQEHCAVIKHVVKTVNKRIPVIAGTGANSTTEAMDLTRCANEAGADACLLVTPYYNKPSQEGLFLHYQAIAKGVTIPQILYNVPGRTACDMLPETVGRLAKISNIVGIKEATGDLQRLRDLIALCGDEFDYYSGDDMTAVDFMLAGGHGNISVTANIVPDKMQQMCQAANSADETQARSLNNGVEALHSDLFLEANPIPVKWALYEMGMIKTGIRLPMTPLARQHREQLKLTMKKVGVLK